MHKLLITQLVTSLYAYDFDKLELETIVSIVEQYPVDIACAELFEFVFDITDSSEKAENVITEFLSIFC